MTRNIVIDRTTIEVARLGFGTASLHHQFSLYRRLMLLQATVEAGITHFDTAPYYGFGLAEFDLGKFMAGRRSKFTVTTKIGLYPLGSYSSNALSLWVRKATGKLIRQFALPVVNWKIEQAKQSLIDSLKRLRSDYVDFLLLHEPQIALLNTDEMLAWLEQEQVRGRIRAWGIAGKSESVSQFVSMGHPLATVVQTQDSLNLRQADFLGAVGRKMQFTYGYLSGSRSSISTLSPTLAIQQALHRNSTGSVLISARSVAHVKQLSSVLQ